MATATTPSAASTRRTMTSAEASRYVGLSVGMLDKLARQGEKLGRIRVGSRVMYLRSSLDKWLESLADRPMAGMCTS